MPSRSRNHDVECHFKDLILPEDANLAINRFRKIEERQIRERLREEIRKTILPMIGKGTTRDFCIKHKLDVDVVRNITCSAASFPAVDTLQEILHRLKSINSSQ